VRAQRVADADTYLDARTGCYEWRRVRYLATLDALRSCGLNDGHTIMDVGAGWTELDHTLRVDGDWRGRYVPVDAGHDGADIDARFWQPPRPADFVVALELIEHMRYPAHLMSKLKAYAKRAVIVSTPNPATTDVLGMDATHRSIITTDCLGRWGFDVQEQSFYGQPADSLFGVWRRG
jgi:hypothetical protein